MSGTNEAESDAELVVLSDALSAEELSAMIGLPPDRSWNIGEGIGSTGRARQPHNGWSIYSRGGTSSPEARVSELLDRIHLVRQRIAGLVGDPRIHGVALWISSSGDRFSLELSPSSLREIARIDGTLKIVAYDLNGLSQADADGSRRAHD